MCMGRLGQSRDLASLLNQILTWAGRILHLMLHFVIVADKKHSLEEAAVMEE